MELLNSDNYYCIEQQANISEAIEKSQIEECVNQTKGISVTFYSMPPEIEVLIQFSLSCILKKYDKISNEDALYNVIFESIVNGLKANAKKLFFLEQGFDINNTADYATGMSLFKKNISKLNIKDSTGKNKDKNLYVRVTFTHNENGMEVEIINNTIILPSEEERIRQKLNIGGKYKDLMSYYLDCSDESEGEGLGLVLSIILLRSMGIDSSLFRIGKREGVTFARIEVPFNDSYKHKRQR